MKVRSYRPAAPSDRTDCGSVFMSRTDRGTCREKGPGRLVRGGRRPAFWHDANSSLSGFAPDPDGQDHFLESALEEARQPRPDSSIGIGALPIYIRYPDAIIGLPRAALEHLRREADDRQE